MDTYSENKKDTNVNEDSVSPHFVIDGNDDKNEPNSASDIKSEMMIDKTDNQNVKMESEPSCDVENIDKKSESKPRQAPKRRASVITISDDSDDLSDGSSICHVESYQASVSEAKRIRGDYSYSGSSDGSSSDDSEAEDDPPSLVIASRPSNLTTNIVQSKKPELRIAEIKMNPNLISEKLEKEFISRWSKQESFSATDLTLHADPFRICILDNFLSDPDAIFNIVDDMNTLDWSRRKMDLYEFHRTTDLANLSWQRGIKAVYELLKGDVLKWVARVTNMNLTHISASCALYGPGDHLLVHDDLLSDRKVAFILYLAPWNILEYPTCGPEKAKGDLNETTPLRDKDDTVLKRGDCETHTEEGGFSKDESDNRVSEGDADYRLNNADSDDRVTKGDETLKINSDDKDSTLLSEKFNSEAAKIDIDSRISSENVDDRLKKANEDSGSTADSGNGLKNKIKIDNGNRIEKGWSQSMGGELQFLNTDSKGLPNKIVKSLLPSNNTFAFFKVCSDSFHQVAEVKSFDFPRLTINGWFHGPPEPDDDSRNPVEPNYEYVGQAPNSDLFQSVFNQYITPTYLSPRTKFKIQQQIESASEISLEDFFLRNQYQTFLGCLQNDTLPWEDCGPANLRHYQYLPIEKITPDSDYAEPLKELVQLYTSQHFFRLLREFTELRLKGYHRFEIQRWTAGSYTVLPPRGEYSANELDTILYLGLPQRRLCGGSTIYLAPEEASDPLITVEMTDNALNLVYSDEGTSKFTKYVSRLSMNADECFYIIICTYRE